MTELYTEVPLYPSGKKELKNPKMHREEAVLNDPYMVSFPTFAKPPGSS